jgi:dihydropteroate synthase
MIPPDLHVSDRWKLRSKTLFAGRMPLLMGIVNITPDSFADGGMYISPEKAVEHGLKLASEGADILDVGGQSTRPGAQRVSVQEELSRVMPVVNALCRLASVPISIDTFEPSVAEEALAVGVEVINDITAFTDPQMLKLAVTSGCGVCAMHMQGTPQTMQAGPQYDDVVVEVLKFLRERRDALLAAGIDPTHIALDPGIGFGKTREHNIALLANAWRLHALDCPVLIGHSRKRFISQMPGIKNVDMADELTAKRFIFDRLPGTIGAALALARQGVQILRVHDVEAVRNALLLFDACGGR